LIVAGSVIVYVSSHGHQAPGAADINTGGGRSSPISFHALVDDDEVADPSDPSQAPVPVRLNFGAKGDSFQTGDVVQTDITLKLSAEQADTLDLLCESYVRPQICGRRRICGRR
jgi:hypothetical protein